MKEVIILCSIDYLLRSVSLCINHLPMFFHLPLSRKKMCPIIEDEPPPVPIETCGQEEGEED